MVVKKTIEPCDERNCVQATPIALINQSMKNIENEVAGLSQTMKDFIKEIKEGYVTQKEHTEVKTQLEQLTGKLWSINFYVIISVIGAILVLVYKN